MKRAFLFMTLLAAGITVSAWMGIEDSGFRSNHSGLLNTSRKHPLLREGEVLIWDPSVTPGPSVPLAAVKEGRGGAESTAVGLIPAADFGPHYEPAYSTHKYYQITRRLERLAKPLGAPRPGDWRTRVREPEQDFGQFVNDSRRAGGLLLIQPIGELPLDARRAIGHLLDAMSAFFGMRAQCLPPIPLSELPRQCFRTAGGIRQINAENLMQQTLRPRLRSGVSSVLAITALNLYPGENWPFEAAFGWSSFKSGTAVVSTADLADGLPANRGRGLLRLTKLALHELSHTLSLKHCSRFNCLMNGSGGLRESDAKPLALCPDCLAKLSLVAGREPEEHLEDMLGLCQAKGFSGESGYYKSALRLVSP